MSRSEALAPLRAATLRENIAEVLLDAILTGKFSPGDRLNESELGRQLHVSRAPIREALHQLHEQGLVMNQPRRGMFVVSLTETDIAKINSLRLVLESEALLLCRARLTPQNERKLLQQIERMEKAGATSQLESTRLDFAFHRLIWSQTGNEFLEKMLASLTSSLFAYALVKRPRSEQMRIILDSHRPLLEFIQGAVPESQARAVMYQHIELRWGAPDRYASSPVLQISGANRPVSLRNRPLESAD
jgi:DNA-binding GntR family transcriptional regulator